MFFGSLVKQNIKDIPLGTDFIDWKIHQLPKRVKVI